MEKQVALADQPCPHLPPGTPALVGDGVLALLAQVERSWHVRAGPRLARRFSSQDYLALVALGARIGALAQSQDHHPQLNLRWGVLEVEVWTHSVGGLSLNDFVLAAGIDRIAVETGF